jgi:uncharacterized protein
MVFKRRNKRTVKDWLVASFYPRGGWTRAAYYVKHRLSRLPDEPHRIARGVFAGVFVSFTPLFGLHFLSAALIAMLMRGNVLAALMATFFGNPITFPIIAATSVELGNWLLGHGGAMHPMEIVSAFGQAGSELWTNITAIFTGEPAEWGRLKRFFFYVYLPYFIGGLAPGVTAALICYYLSLPLIAAYQKLRKKRLRDRAEKLRSMAAARLRAQQAPGRDDAGPRKP